jgi:hypothetical protein
MLKITS